MAFYEDFSFYEFFERYKKTKHINIGWLEDGYCFETADLPSDFLDKLWDFCNVLVIQTRGLHYCDFCAEKSKIVIHRNGVEHVLGDSEIRVFGERQVFASPNMIYHYVQKHHYQPPAAFVKAVYDCPNPSSNEYFELLEKEGLPWMLMNGRKSNIEKMKHPLQQKEDLK